MEAIQKYPIRLAPCSTDAIWGGRRLISRYGKVADGANLAESWELSVREREKSVITNGCYADSPLGEYVAHAPVEIIGTNVPAGAPFPLLIKFIDAADRLSVQVHPDNGYAAAHESESGKTELWVILDADPGAELIYGLAGNCTVSDVSAAMAEGRIMDVLNRVPVHPGDVFFIPPGTVHAIGGGITLAEIQENSDLTYRVYDYDRPGLDGKPRPLHQEAALAVMKNRTPDEISTIRYARPHPTIDGELLASCDPFTVLRITVDEAHPFTYTVGGGSFVSLLILSSDGASLITDGTDDRLCGGESWFLPAGLGTFTVAGKAVLLLTMLSAPAN